MKTVAIVQARMSATRLPGKVLKEVRGLPILQHVVLRTSRAKLIDLVIVATTNNSADDKVAEFCLDNKIECFRGDEDDVLDRYYMAAKKYCADIVVRITADCPLLDPVIVDRVVSALKKGNKDYAANIIRYTYPDGLDVEALSFEALERAWREAGLPSEREHVTPYIRNSGNFSLTSVECAEDLSQEDLRWTVDEEKDLEFVRKVYEEIYPENPHFCWQDVWELIKRRPDIRWINSSAIRNEGYYKSILQMGEEIPPKNLVLRESQKYLERACKVIPSQTQTFSKGHTQFVKGACPLFLSHGKGSTVWDVDGNEYVDLVLGLGPVVLGYDYPSVTSAASKQLRKGMAFSLPHKYEVELAEMIVDMVPCAEMVRYGKNGSDATTGAVRVARAYTGREKIACCGYHGWHDWFIGTTTRDLGVPACTKDLTLTFNYNDIESLETLFDRHHGQIAAVIMEPTGIVAPENGFLEKVRDVAHRNGALLVFDEVITGFRLALGGAQEYFGVTPDLATFGKAMANGHPLSAVAGKKEIMALFDDCFYSFTFGGEAVSLAASIATLEEMRDKNVIGHLWEQGGRLQDGYNTFAKKLGLADVTWCQGLAPHTVMNFTGKDDHESLLIRSLMQQELASRGVLFLVGNNICFSHGNREVEHVLRAYLGALKCLAEARADGDIQERLRGSMVQPVFRKP